MAHLQTALNCIVDDSALIASVRENAKLGLKHWLAQGAINVFIPLYALDRLNALRGIISPISADARKALEWLDQVTSTSNAREFGRVQLQGPEDQYQDWREVERYLLPDTPLTLQTGAERVDALSKVLEQGLSLHTAGSSSAPLAPNTSRISPAASPTSSLSSMSSGGPEQNEQSADKYSSALAAHGVSSKIWPLLNYVVWRTQHEDTISGSPGRYILVTNDSVIQKQASKFGVRAKLLKQLQQILAKDENRLNWPRDAAVNDSTLEEPESEHRVHSVSLDDDEEDEVVFDPSKRPGSSRGPNNPPNLLDPDHFGRSPKGKSSGVQEALRGSADVPRRAGALTRGRGHTPRLSGSASRGPAPSLPVFAPTAPRGPTQGRGRATTHPSRGSRTQQVPRPIDPDSYARPTPARGRGRGGTQRLWDPTSSG